MKQKLDINFEILAYIDIEFNTEVRVGMSCVIHGRISPLADDFNHQQGGKALSGFQTLLSGNGYFSLDLSSFLIINFSHNKILFRSSEKIQQAFWHSGRRIYHLRREKRWCREK